MAKLYISGQAPVENGELVYKGKVGSDISIEDGKEAAKLCVINIIAALKTGLEGDWDRLDSFVKLSGFVNCQDNFTDQPKIINGCLLYTSPSPRDKRQSRMPSSA